MNFLEYMNESLKYIEEHLTEEIDFEAVAKTACCSAYHYQRLFSFITNMTLGEYIRRRRLSLAAICLQENKEKVIDVAMKYGYQSPTAFTRAFINIHGISPSKARQKGAKLKLYPPISFQISIKGEEVMNYRIEEKESFRLVGIKRGIGTENGQNFIQIPKLWEDVCKSGLCKEIIELSVDEKKDMFGVCANFREGEFDYYIAVRSTKMLPEGMEEIEIPAGTWVVFETKEVAGIQDVFKRLYTEWFPTSGYQHAGGAEIEYYPGEEMGKEKAKCEVWIPIVKR